MKRSEINEIMRSAEQFIRKMHFPLPPFASFRPEDFEGKWEEYAEIRDNMLGWDITDFGSGDFYKKGLLMITLRNGNSHDARYAKPYAEKLLIVEEEQITPFHFHWSKMEDIINRGGGNLLVQVFGSTEEEGLSEEPVTVWMDGRHFSVPAGTVLTVHPGESISLQPGQYHQFWGEKGTGRILLGEVSKVNDDRVDNRFLEPTGRFPAIEEDETPLHLLCGDYMEHL